MTVKKSSTCKESVNHVSLLLTEWINGLNGRLGHNKVTPAKLVLGSHPEEVLDSFHQVHGHQAQLLIGWGHRHPLICGHILLLDDIVGDDSAAVVLWSLPCQVGGLASHLRNHQVSGRRGFVCLEDKCYSSMEVC